MAQHCPQTRQRAPLPVMARTQPIGAARDRRAAVRLALRFLAPCERMLIDAGWTLACYESAGAYRVTWTR